MDVANGEIVKGEIAVAKIKFGADEWCKLDAWDAAAQSP